ncbi:hypothetical protein EB796_002561 [Bugula neritina]|uniref:TGF-beta family profile domain-containing protein n=1 Tax=Bugula neritina TaxID=10212 RepID=A0A7J7KLN1_BUGNE|nr:hypothetical protein EB796_002561 [Bugula neritina]
MNRERVRRQATQTSATPLCNSQNNRTKCCLQSTQVPSEQLDGSLLLAEMPTLVTIYRCSGLCPITTGTETQNILDENARRCCRKIDNIYDPPVEATFYDGLEAETVYSKQLNATHCSC